MNKINKLWRLRTIPWPETLLLLILVGKFYYLLGFFGHLKTLAPLYVILIKDYLLILAIVLFFRPFSFSEFKNVEKVWTVIFAWMTFIAILHGLIKPFHDWGQHYVRNILLIVAFFPAAYGIVAKTANLNIPRLLYIAGWLNFIVALYQAFLNKSLMLDGTRPLGLSGDPISLTFLLMLWIPTLAYFSPWWFSLLVAPFVGYLLNLAASVSAFGTGSVGLLVLIFFGVLFCRNAVWFKKVHIGLLCIILGACLGMFVPVKSPENSLTGRYGMLFSYIHNKADETQPVSEYTVQRVEDLSKGRIISQTSLLEFCPLRSIKEFSLLSQCLLGGYKSDIYRRFDSNITTIVFNWGWITVILTYLGIGLIWIRGLKKLILSYKTKDKSSSFELFLDCFIVAGTIALGLTNTVFYRFPINFLFVVGLAHIVYLTRAQTQNLKIS